MENIKVTRTNENEQIIALDTRASWSFDSGLILCEDGTRIMFSEEEVVLLKNKVPKTHLTFIQNAHSLHQIETEYGIIKLDVFTNSITVNDSGIKIIYLLEAEENILLIERT